MSEARIKKTKLAPSLLRDTMAQTIEQWRSEEQPTDTNPFSPEFLLPLHQRSDIEENDYPNAKYKEEP